MTMFVLSLCYYIQQWQQGNSVARALPPTGSEANTSSDLYPQPSYLYPSLALFTLTKHEMSLFLFLTKTSPTNKFYSNKRPRSLTAPRSNRITSEKLHDAIHLGSTSILLINIEKYVKMSQTWPFWPLAMTFWVIQSNSFSSQFIVTILRKASC